MGNTDLNIGRYLGEGWELFKANGANFAAATLIILLVNVVAGMIPLAPLLVSGPLMGALSLMALDAARGEKPEIARLGGVSAFLVPTVMIGLLTGLFGFVGTLLFVLPGILVFGWYMFSYMIALDTGASFWDAMERSRTYGFSNHFGVFLFALALLAVNFAGALMLGIGLLVTIPVSTLAVAAAYRDILAREAAPKISASATSESAPPPPPSVHG